MSNPYIGEIRMFGGSFAPAGWAFCNGQLMPISENDALFTLIGTTYGGDGQETFGIPDLQGRIPIHAGQGPGISQTYQLGETGGVESVTLTTNQIPIHTHALHRLRRATARRLANPHNNVLARSSLVNAYINETAEVPTWRRSASAQSAAASRTRTCSRFCASATSSRCSASSRISDLEGHTMSSPFVAEIRIFACNFAPTGWAQCNGQLLPLSQNTALFSLLGTFYGGDGKSTFALPNLEGSAAIGQGQGAGLSQRFLGEQGGSQFITLLTSEMPLHTHTLRADRRRRHARHLVGQGDPGDIGRWNSLSK